MNKNFSYYFNQALKLDGKKNYNLAIENYKMAVLLADNEIACINAKKASAYNNMAICFADLGEYNQALKAFNTCYKLHKDNFLKKEIKNNIENTKKIIELLQSNTA